MTRVCCIVRDIKTDELLYRNYWEPTPIEYETINEEWAKKLSLERAKVVKSLNEIEVSILATESLESPLFKIYRFRYNDMEGWKEWKST